MISIWTALMPIVVFIVVIPVMWLIQIDKDRKAKIVDLYIPNDKIKEFLRRYHNTFVAGKGNVVERHEFWKYARESLKDEIEEKCKGKGRFGIDISSVVDPKLIFTPK